MKININEKIINQIGFWAEEYQQEVYIVGGYVRDKLLGFISKDYDFVVVGDGIDFAKKIAKELGLRKVIIYKRFETAKLPLKNNDIEFVSARSEIYTKDSRKPLVIKASLETDLARRDFTINALAARIYGSQKGEIIDFYQGLQDLDLRVLKTPLDPYITYQDDPLRMIRAIRFASRLQYRIDNNSWNAILKNKNRIEVVSQERINDEFFKIIDNENCAHGLDLLYNSGLLKIIFKDIYNIIMVNDVKKKILAMLQDKRVLGWNVMRKIALIFFMFDFSSLKTQNYIEELSSYISQVCLDFKWSNNIKKYLISMLICKKKMDRLFKYDYDNNYLLKKNIYESKEIFQDFIIFYEILLDYEESCNLEVNFLQKMLDVEKSESPSKMKLAVNGQDLKSSLGEEEGLIVGKMISFLLDAVLKGEVSNQKQKLLEYIKRNKKDI